MAEFVALVCRQGSRADSKNSAEKPKGGGFWNCRLQGCLPLLILVHCVEKAQRLRTRRGDFEDTENKKPGRSNLSAQCRRHRNKVRILINCEEFAGTNKVPSQCHTTDRFDFFF